MTLSDSSAPFFLTCTQLTSICLLLPTNSDRSWSSCVTSVRRRLSDSYRHACQRDLLQSTGSYRCLNDVNAWLSASRLRLNPAKTDLVAQIEASGQWHCSHAGTGPGVISQCGWLSAWPWFGYRLLSHDSGSCFGHLMSVWLISTAPAASCRPM